MEKEKKNQPRAEGPDRKEGTREEPDFLKTCFVTMVEIPGFLLEVSPSQYHHTGGQASLT